MPKKTPYMEGFFSASPQVEITLGMSSENISRTIFIHMAKASFAEQRICGYSDDELKERAEQLAENFAYMDRIARNGPPSTALKMPYDVPFPQRNDGPLRNYDVSLSPAPGKLN